MRPGGRITIDWDPIREERPMRKLVALAAVVVLLAAACGDDDDSEATGSGGDEAGGVEVVAKDFKFDPTTLDANPGDVLKITFKNEGSVEHNITVKDLDVDEDAEAGESADVSIDIPDDASGSIGWICKYHPSQMKGTIEVGGASGSGGGDTTSTSSGAGAGY
jgi:plastocyanin